MLYVSHSHSSRNVKVPACPKALTAHLIEACWSQLRILLSDRGADVTRVKVDPEIQSCCGGTIPSTTTRQAGGWRSDASSELYRADVSGIAAPEVTVIGRIVMTSTEGGFSYGPELVTLLTRELDLLTPPKRRQQAPL